MMNKSFIGLLCATVLCLNVLGQKAEDKVLMTIGGEDIFMSEFLRVYNKNQGISTQVQKKSVPDYLEMFTNFKLKVIEAESLGMDTVSSFVRELDGYRAQLAKPYLIDSKVSKHLVQEAYDRLQLEVSASHILINVDENAKPSDTLRAYNRIMDLRKKIQQGADFGAISKKHSNDPSALDNGGSLGYFSALYMVYPFESAAFNTPVGEMTMPVRTRFGYHVLKIHDKREARGKVHVAHLMVKANARMNEEELKNAKIKIDELYVRLRNGEDFNQLAELYSDDKVSAKNGGVLPTFGINEMVEPFENAAFGLEKAGDISAPTKTDFGWHIIQLKEKEAVKSFNEMRYELESRIQKDSRAQLSKKVFIDRLKKEYQVKEYLKERNDFYTLVNADYFAATWNTERALRYKSTLLVIDGEKIKQPAFTEFLASKQVRNAKKIAIDVLVDKLYIEFVEKCILDYENSRLEEKYPDFKNLMQEYRDGILLFELMGDKVWNKATRDTAGLKSFFDSRREVYIWGDRVDASIVSAANAKMAKKSKKYIEKGKTSEWILEKLNAKSQLNVSFERGIFAEGDDVFVDANKIAMGSGAFVNSEAGVKFVYVHENLKPSPKELIDARGVVIADYQSYLELEWIKELRQKFPVTVKSDLLSEIK
jgi:peptidyl-prolyl cis-trans isomerase SurA